MKTEKEKTEKMICEIFKLCDSTVWIEDWLDFQKSFDKIVKKFGYNLYPIYFGKTKAEFIKSKKEVYDKWVSDKKKSDVKMRGVSAGNAPKTSVGSRTIRS